MKGFGELEQVEKKVLAELRKVTGNQKLLAKDILEWSVYELEAEDGTKIVHLPELDFYVKIEE